MTEWRYEIQYGPEGEANYAWVYKGDDMIATMKTHHAIEVVKALSASPAGVGVEDFVLVPRDGVFNPGTLVKVYEKFAETHSIEQAFSAGVAHLMDYHALAALKGDEQ